MKTADDDEDDTQAGYDDEIFVGCLFMVDNVRGDEHTRKAPDQFS